MKFLAEVQNTVEYLVEGGAEDKTPKKHYIKGLFLEFDAPNKNNRIYRSAMHDPTVGKYIKERVEDKRGWGELDHPDGPTINLKNASHRITKMWKEGKDWYGQAEIVHNAVGQLVIGLLETGGNLGVSSRGLGSLKEVSEGVLEVQGDYKIITAADIVSDPSAHGALVKGIMENVEWFYDESTGVFMPEQAENLKKTMKTMTVKEIEDRKSYMFEAFLNSLKQ